MQPMIYRIYTISFIRIFILMNVAMDTPIVISIWALIWVLWVARRLSWNISKFKENITERLTTVEKCMMEHVEMEKENKVSERLARIETDIQWIRSALSNK